MATIQIPWAAWYGDHQIELTFPAQWDVVEAQMQDAPPLSDQDIQKQLSTPVGTLSLRALAGGRTNVVIVVEDITRPAPVHRLLPDVLAELEAGGIPKEQMRILIGMGSHRPLTRLDLMKKLGRSVVETIEIRNHHPYENLVSLGISNWGSPILINKEFLAADLKIAIGSIIPHGDVGFGGGAKVVGIGVAGTETLEANHFRVAVKEPVGVGRLAGNACRAEIEEIATRAGLEMTIDVVLNSRREIAGVFAGHPLEAYREGVRFARRIYATQMPERVDVAVFNAYPKDTELMLALNALNVGYGRGERLIRPNGTVVITVAASEGYGYHSVVERQSFVYSPEVCWNRRLALYSPNLGPWDVRRYCPEGTLLFNDWSNLLQRLKTWHPGQAQAVVFPCGALQLGGGEYPV